MGYNFCYEKNYLRWRLKSQILSSGATVAHCCHISVSSRERNCLTEYVISTLVI